MKSKVSILSIFILTVCFSFVRAQVPANFMQNLQIIIHATETGTISNFKGEKITGFGSDTYRSKVQLTGHGGIAYDENKSWYFLESLTINKNDFDKYLNFILSNLPKSDWVVCNEYEKKENIKVIKNLKSRVFIKLSPFLNTLTVYLQKNSTAKCLWGNCQFGYGSYLYENDDIYTGDYINGNRNGKGIYTWADSGQYYDGCWLNGEMNGEGAMYNSDKTLIRKGYKYKNQWIDVDVKTMPVFTMGEKQNGFGMLYDNGNYKVSTFKDSQLSGMSMIKNSNLLFGTITSNSFEGPCIKYYENGNIFYGNFINGIVTGKGILYYPSGNKFEGEFTAKTNKGSKYDSYDLLMQKESSNDGKKTVDNSPETLDLVKFAQSLSYICKTGADNLKGENISEEFFVIYKSKYKLYGAIKTEIELVDFIRLEVVSKMNNAKLAKNQALTLYNSMIDKVKNSVSSFWNGKETLNKDNESTINRIYSFTSNYFDYSFEVKCWFNDVEVIVKE